MLVEHRDLLLLGEHGQRNNCVMNMFLTSSKAAITMRLISALTLITSTILLNLSLNSCCAFAANEDYPMNLQEKSYLEKLSRRTFTARIDDGPDQTKPSEMLKILSKELARLKNHPARDSQSERSLILVERYLDVGQVSLDRCNEEWLLNLLFTVQNNQDNDKSALPLYLRDSAIRQFDLCQPIWDERLAAAIDQLDPEVRENMELLLKHIIARNPEGLRKQEFYTREILKEAVKNRSSHSLLSFLSQLGKLDGIADEDLKSITSISFEEFSHIYDETIIESLCIKVCVTLQQPSDVYKIAFQPDLMRYRKQDGRPTSTSDYLHEWLANKLICCDLVADQKLKEATYEELVGSKA